MYINMPIDVKYIIDKLIDNGYEAYIVGGCVRDNVLNRIPKDFDITTSAKPHEIIELFDKVVLTGIKHGTVTVVLNCKNYEITTYRSEGVYIDNRRPSNVKFIDNLKDDLARRDLTINAMAYNNYEGLKDYFGGIDDLKKCIIRTVGNPNTRFSEDALRMIRAVRFSAELDFEIEEDCLKAISYLAKNISCISNERVRDEFQKILISNPQKINILRNCGLLEYILPELEYCYGYIEYNNYDIYDAYEHSILSAQIANKKIYLRWALLLHEIPKVISKNKNHDEDSNFGEVINDILRRLKYDRETIVKTIMLVKYSGFEISDNISLKKLLHNLGEDLTRDLIEFKLAHILSQNPVYAKERILKLEAIRNEVNSIVNNNECFNIKSLDINGRDLIDLGITGRNVGIILDLLLNYVIYDSTLNKKSKLKELAKHLYEDINRREEG